MPICRLQKDDLSIFIISAFIALSGYFYTYILNNKLIYNYNIRFVVILLLLIFFIYKAATNSPAFPLGFFWISVLLFYMAVVTFIINDPGDYISPFIRFLLYILSGIFIFNSNSSKKYLKIFFLTTGVFYIFSIFFDYAIGRFLLMNNAVRLCGSVGSPIGFAGTVSITSIGLFYFWLEERKPIYLVLISLLVGGGILTGTRSVVVLGIFMIALLYLSDLRLSFKGFFKLSFMIVLVVSALWSLILYTDIGVRFQLLFNNIQSDSSLTFRLFILEIVNKHFTGYYPIFGIGLGGFPQWFENTTGFTGIAPHFEILWLYTEGGAMGILFYFLFIFTFFKSMANALFLKKIDRRLFLFGSVTVLSHITLLQMSNPMYFYQIMIPIFMAMGFVMRKINPKIIKP